MAEVGAVAAHCPTSNSALASGFFPLRRHLEAGVRVALGSDVGAGTGFNLFKEGVQSYFMQQLDPTGGVALTPAHLLHLATKAGAEALELDEVGELSVGNRFDAVLVRPAAGQPLDVGIRHAESDDGTPWRRSSPWAPPPTSRRSGSTAPHKNHPLTPELPDGGFQQPRARLQGRRQVVLGGKS
jgi:hypothetical protein